MSSSFLGPDAAEMREHYLWYLLIAILVPLFYLVVAVPTGDPMIGSAALVILAGVCLSCSEEGFKKFRLGSFSFLRFVGDTFVVAVVAGLLGFAIYLVRGTFSVAPITAVVVAVIGTRSFDSKMDGTAAFLTAGAFFIQVIIVGALVVVIDRNLVR